MNTKTGLLLRSALTAIGITSAVSVDIAQADTPFKALDRSSDRILIAADKGCGKGSCGTDAKGAADAKKAHGKKKTKEASCKTADGSGKEASCSSHDKDSSKDK